MQQLGNDTSMDTMFCLKINTYLGGIRKKKINNYKYNLKGTSDVDYCGYIPCNLGFLFK